MDISPDTLLDMPIEQDFLPGDNAIQLQCTDEGLRILGERDTEPRVITLETIRSWEFGETEAVFTVEESEPLVFAAEPEVLEELRLCFNRLRMKRAVQAMGAKERKGQRLLQCRSCESLMLVDSSKAVTRCCPECQALLDEEGRSRSHSSGYRYEFCGAGDFALVGREGMPWSYGNVYRPAEGFLNQMTPIFERLLSQVLWMLIALGTLGLITAGVHWGWIGGRGWTTASYACIALAFFSMLMAGYYWSGLMLAKAVSITLRPPLWERLRRYLLSGRFSQAEELWEKMREKDHPGLLTNWAIAHYLHGDREKGDAFMEQALQACPNHPMIRELQSHFAKAPSA